MLEWSSSLLKHRFSRLKAFGGALALFNIGLLACPLAGSWYSGISVICNCSNCNYANLPFFVKQKFNSLKSWKLHNKGNNLLPFQEMEWSFFSLLLSIHHIRVHTSQPEIELQRIHFHVLWPPFFDKMTSGSISSAGYWLYHSWASLLPSGVFGRNSIVMFVALVGGCVQQPPLHWRLVRCLCWQFLMPLWTGLHIRHIHH